MAGASGPLRSLVQLFHNENAGHRENVKSMLCVILQSCMYVYFQCRPVEG